MLVEFAYLLDSDAKHLYDLMRMNTCLQEMIQVFADEVRSSPYLIVIGTQIEFVLISAHVLRSAFACA